MLTINGSAVASPSYMTVALFDVSSGARNAQGGAVIDRVCEKRRLEMRWNALSPGDTAALMAAISEPFFSVVYPDPVTQNDRTANFSAAQKRLGILIKTETETYWRDVCVTLEEQ